VGINTANGTVTLKNIVIHPHGEATETTSAAARKVLDVISCTIAHQRRHGHPLAGTTTGFQCDPRPECFFRTGVNGPKPGLNRHVHRLLLAKTGRASVPRELESPAQLRTPVAVPTNEAGNCVHGADRSLPQRPRRADPPNAFARNRAYNGGRNPIWGRLRKYVVCGQRPPVSQPRRPAGGGGGGGCGLDSALEGVLAAGPDFGPRREEVGVLSPSLWFQAGCRGPPRPPLMAQVGLMRPRADVLTSCLVFGRATSLKIRRRALPLHRECTRWTSRSDRCLMYHNGEGN